MVHMVTRRHGRVLWVLGDSETRLHGAFGEGNEPKVGKGGCRQVQGPADVQAWLLHSLCSAGNHRGRSDLLNCGMVTACHSVAPTHILQMQTGQLVLP